MAWKRRSRPCLAVPPAHSPSTRKSSQSARVFLLAIGELAGEAAGIEGAFAAGEVAGFAGGFARARGLDGLADDLAADGRVLLEVLAQLLVDELGHLAGDVAVELALGLALELGLRNLDADDGGETFAHVVAGEVLLDVFEELLLLAEGVDGAGEGAAEAGEMGAAVDGVDVVGEAEDVLAVAVVVLEGDLHGEGAAVGQEALGFEVDRLFVEDALAPVEVADEFADAAGIKERVILMGSTRSSVSVILRPLLRKASSRRRWARVS